MDVAITKQSSKKLRKAINIVLLVMIFVMAIMLNSYAENPISHTTRSYHTVILECDNPYHFNDSSSLYTLDVTCN